MALYSIKDNYKFSSAFTFIHSQIEEIRIVFKEFLNDGFTLVDEKQKKIDIELDKLKKENPEEAEIYYQHDYEYHRYRLYDMKETFLYSGVGYLYSQFDIFFLKTANQTKELFKSNKSISSYKNKCKKFNRDIYKSKNYISDTFKINLEEFDNNWIKIENFKKLRNYFVHQNGVFLKDKKFEKFIKDQANINIVDEKIVFSKDYLVEMCDVLIDYLNNIMNKIYESHKESRKKII